MPRTVHRPFVVASRRYSAGALAALVTLGAAPAVGRAQAAAAAPSPGDSAAVAVQLDSARAAFTRALSSGDKTTMLAAFTDSATVASPFTPAAVGADEFLDHWLQQQTVVTALRPGRVQIAGPRDATESGVYTLGNSGGGSYTIAWRRAPSGRWAVRSLSTS